jgi:WD40-like Beta Propeller Repeat
MACTATALSTAPASAVNRYIPGTSFGELCTSEPCGGGQFTEPTGIATNDSTEPLSEPAAGDVYVVDTGNVRVQRLTADGTFLSAFAGTETPAKSFLEPEGVAVDNSGKSAIEDPSVGDVYVADDGHNVIDKFTPEGVYISQLTETATAPLAEVRGVTVDHEGNVWVYEAAEFIGKLDEFSSNGAFIQSISTGAGTHPGVAADDAEHLYAITTSSPDSVAKVEIASGGVEALFGGEEDTAVAVDPTNNNVLLDQGASVALYGPFAEPSTAPVEVFGAGDLDESHGVAVNSESTAYLSQKANGKVKLFDSVVLPGVVTQTPSGVTETSMTLHGTVDPAGEAVTECSFEYGVDTSYGNSIPCAQTPAEIGTGTGPVSVTAEVVGLSPAAVRHIRLDAVNANGAEHGNDVSISRPTIEGESVSGVTAASAKLGAQVDPNGFQSTYRFEYGFSTAYEHSVPVPDGALGSGSVQVAVSNLIQGLNATATYHYRVVATNGLGASVGEDRSFTAQGTELASLPDGRAWELVSPAEKHGAGLESISEEGGLIQAAENGNAIAYIAAAPVTPEPQGNRSIAYSEVLSRREAGVWKTKDIATPHEQTTEILAGASAEYRAFSPNLSSSVVEPAGETLLGTATEGTPYLRSEGGEFTPLVTEANVLPETKFGHNPKAPAHHGVTFSAATASQDRIVLGSLVALKEQAVGGEEQSLYEWSNGELELVSILPNGRSTTVEGDQATLGFGENNVRNALADDGQRVIFGSARHLYVRDLIAKETVEVDAPEAGAPGLGGLAVFQLANSDGSKIFFTDEGQLTTDATAETGKPDLYVCEVVRTAGHLACDLRDLTVEEHAGEAADVQGVVMGASEDGSRVYFVANGRLAPGASPGSCIPLGSGSIPPPGTICNLYTYDTDTGERSFVASLSNFDGPDWEAPSGNLGRTTSRVSPDGRYLAFMSERSLTGYDNVDAKSGERDEEVYLFDVESRKLTCASCNPSGARPVGVFDPAEYPGLVVDRPQIWGGQWLAASIPGWTRVQLSRALYQSRYLSDDGRLFFNSADALVPGDSNGKEDVYEFEPSGVGSCSGGSACVGLISSGTSGEESAFLDASASGDDVFFLTTAGLVKQDNDGAFDVYDAHVCTTAEPCPSEESVSPPPCASTETCRQVTAAAPEGIVVPASAAVSASGNLPPVPVIAKAKPKAPTRAQLLAKALKTCRAKRDKRKRKSCEAGARRKYGPAKKAKAKAKPRVQKGGK